MRLRRRRSRNPTTKLISEGRRIWAKGGQFFSFVFFQSELVPLIKCYSTTRDRTLLPPVRQLGFRSHRFPAPAAAALRRATCHLRGQNPNRHFSNPFPSVRVSYATLCQSVISLWLESSLEIIAGFGCIKPSSVLYYTPRCTRPA